MFCIEAAFKESSMRMHGLWKAKKEIKVYISAYGVNLNIWKNYYYSIACTYLLHIFFGTDGFVSVLWNNRHFYDFTIKTNFNKIICSYSLKCLKYSEIQISSKSSFHHLKWTNIIFFRNSLIYVLTLVRVSYIYTFTCGLKKLWHFNMA